ncbi:MAG: PD40 domain-containing protein [Acidobacteria bacterium]|nr:PD40 domain-containing protein [Acidobacteriota bacterium]
MPQPGQDFPPAEIQAQLARILAAPSFARAHRSSQLLSYLVQSALDNRLDQLKEYPIAIDVFGRDKSFDPRIDSLVRVEVNRLRNRLAAYYETATEADTILITLSPGAYLPIFEYRRPHPPPTPPRRPNLYLILPAIALVALIAISLFRSVGNAHIGLAIEHPTIRRLSLPQEVLFFPALAPNGKEIYFASNRGQGPFRIWRQQWDGAAAVSLTPPDSDAFDLDISPDGRWIAYRSARLGGAIYQQPAAGGEELLVVADARSPRFSPDSQFILYWQEGKPGAFSKVFKSGITPGRHDREPIPIAPDFDDAHTPQWTPGGRILLCGTLRTNVPNMEHDLWIVSTGAPTQPHHKTGILPFLAQRGISLHTRIFPATSFRLLPGSLIFSGLHNGRSAVYNLPLSTTYQPAGEPIALHDPALSADNPAISGNQLAFATLATNLDIWEIALDSGTPRRLTNDPSDQFSATTSSNGRFVFYTTTAPAITQLWRKDTVSGVESLLYQFPNLTSPRAAPDSSKVYFRTLAGPPPQRQAIHSIHTATGALEVACEDCGTPTSVSPQSTFVAYETGSRIPRIAILDTRSHSKQDILTHPHHGVLAARISPDSHWLAFELDKGVDGRQIFIAPFRGIAPIPENEWIPVTSSGFNCEPAWSPDSTSLYFLSNRNGSRDLWRQPLTPTHKPQHGPELIHSFRNAALTPVSYSERNTRNIGLSIVPGRAILTLSELSSDLQLVRLTADNPM